MGSQRNKFYQIVTEVWPLINSQYCILLNILLTNGQILIFFFILKLDYTPVELNFKNDHATYKIFGGRGIQTTEGNR